MRSGVAAAGRQDGAGARPRRRPGRAASGNVRRPRWSNSAATTPQTIQLRDVLTVLDTAAGDPKISSVVLLLDEFEGAGLATLREIGGGRPLPRQRQAGGGLGLELRPAPVLHRRARRRGAAASDGHGVPAGFGGYRNYYRDALDKVGVRVNLLRVGTLQELRRGLHRQRPVARVARGRQLSATATCGPPTPTASRRRASCRPARDGNDRRAAAAPGRGRRRRRQAGAGRQAGRRPEDARRAARADDRARRRTTDEARPSARCSFESYLAASRPRATGRRGRRGRRRRRDRRRPGAGRHGRRPVDGRADPQGARRQDIKAVVLRVNSPGGSVVRLRTGPPRARAHAARRQAGGGVDGRRGGLGRLLDLDGRPTKSWPTPATITGSIGVFALLPSADKALEKLGVHTAGVTTTWLGGAADPRLPLDPRLADLVQTQHQPRLRDFTARSPQARKTTPRQDRRGRPGPGLDRRAGQGARAGRHARPATATRSRSAATRAKLGDDPRVVYIEREPGGFARSSACSTRRSRALVGAEIDDAHRRPSASPPCSLPAGRDLGWLVEHRRAQAAFAAVVHCLCGEPF